MSVDFFEDLQLEQVQVGLVRLRVRRACQMVWYRPDAAAMGQHNHDDFLAAITNPGVVHAMCEDYRAGLGIDRVADDVERAAGRRLQCPLLVLWASGDDVGTLYGDPPQVWQPWTEPGSERLSGHVIVSGHICQRTRRRSWQLPCGPR